MLDSTQRQQSLLGFNKYLAAVSLKDVPRETKLEAIVETFADNCVLLASTGETYTGKEGVRKFFGNVLAMSKDTFLPVPVQSSICVSEDGTVVAAEVNLPQINKFVGDFWTFKNDKISRLVIYARQ